MFPQVTRAKFLAILGTFDSLDKRPLASGNESDNQIGRYAKRGWALRRVFYMGAGTSASAAQSIAVATWGNTFVTDWTARRSSSFIVVTICSDVIVSRSIDF